MRRITALLASLALILALAPVTALAVPTSELDTSGDRIAGSWIVTLRDGVDSSAHAPALARQAGGRVGFVYEHALNGFSFKGSDDAAAALLRNPLVARVEADGPVQVVETTQTGATWGLDRLDDRELVLDGTYTYAFDGSGVTAYIIDTGIRISHDEFKVGRATYGRDTVDGDMTSDDCHGHGTHVAGTVGGTTYGVAKKVALVAVRVLDCNGSGTWTGVIAGIDWVTGNAAKPAVANMSLGGSANDSVDEAVENSIASGVSYAVAAGNGNRAGIAQDACKYSPARAPNAMTIGATDKTDTKASWSNYGPCVDWFAPGVGITAAWNTSNTDTKTISGTSMASPHTAGAAALYLHANPGATPAQVRDGLHAATTKGIVKSSNTANNHLLFSRFDLDGSGGGSDPANTAPMAAAVNAGTNEDTAVAVTLSGSDAEQCELTFSIVSGPSNGSLGSISDADCKAGTPNTDSATIPYTPEPNSNGEDSFTYRVSDGSLTDDATVTISVSAADDPPTAVDDAYTTPTNTQLSVAKPGVLANDSDVDGDSLAAVAVTNGLSTQGGKYSLNADGSFTYMPKTDFVGSDSFDYTVSDPSGKTDTGTVTIHVGSNFGVTLSTESINNGSTWIARVTVLATDSADRPVMDATVYAHWNGEPADSEWCKTTSAGTCTLERSLHKSVGSITFTVDRAEHATLPYDGGTDSVTLFKP